jgi:hypothetical protein
LCVCEGVEWGGVCVWGYERNGSAYRSNHLHSMRTHVEQLRTRTPCGRRVPCACLPAHRVARAAVNNTVQQGTRGPCHGAQPARQSQGVQTLAAKCGGRGAVHVTAVSVAPSRETRRTRCNPTRTSKICTSGGGVRWGVSGCVCVVCVGSREGEGGTTHTVLAAAISAAAARK